MMCKKAIVMFFIVLLSTLLVSCGGGNPVVPSNDEELDGEDFIHIISVTPDSGLIDGVDTDFAVVVEYNLVSRDTGLLMIGFNNGDEIEISHMISNASHIVNKGSGKYTFNVNALTKNWGTQGDFVVDVNISEYPHPNPWTALVFDHYALAFY